MKTELEKPLSENTSTSLIKCIAFDMDGTLFTCEQIIGGCYQRAISSFNSQNESAIRIPESTEIISHVGLPVKKIFENLFPELSEEIRDKLNNMTLNELREGILAKEGELIPYADEVLSHLHKVGYRLTLASNGRRSYLDAILKAYGWENYFNDYVAVDYKQYFNKKDILEEVQRRYDLKNKEIVMVGDRYSDYEGAQNADTHFIGFAWSYGDAEELKNATYLISDLREIFGILDILNKQE